MDESYKKSRQSPGREEDVFWEEQRFKHPIGRQKSAGRRKVAALGLLAFTLTVFWPFLAGLCWPDAPGRHWHERSTIFDKSALLSKILVAA